MMRLRAAAFATLAACAFPALAQDAPPNYGSVMGSFVLPDSARDGEDGVGWHLLYGSPVTNWLSIELNGFGHQVQHETNNLYDYFYGAGLDLRFGRGNEFFYGFALLGGGAAYEDYPGEEETSPYANVGLGFLLQLPAPNLKLRTEGRYYAVFNDEIYPGEDQVFDARLSAGLEFLFDDLPVRTIAGGERDSDRDGVIDSHDDCPGTGPGIEVNGRGCPIPADEDGDTVLNAQDLCPGTPRGTLVDVRGCPVVVPPPVDTPLDVDSDRDGVLDSGDRCPSTSAGAVVDAFGCPVDEDEDGVLNSADACPATPRGLRVNDTGCVDRPQTVVLKNVNFEFDSARLTREARSVLDGVAAGLKGQPGMQVEIAGHTDGLGTQDYNLKLSQARAAAVRAFLIDRGINPGRLTSAGYGEYQPVTENDTEEGRALNRRVEFRVLR